MDSFVYTMALLHCWIVKVWTVLPAYFTFLSHEPQDEYQGLRLEAPSLLIPQDGETTYIFQLVAAGDVH
jgi:hypothetical protein